MNSIAILLAAVYALDARTPELSLADRPDYDLRPGLRFAARVKFDPAALKFSENPVLAKGNVSADPGAYLLRVDGTGDVRKFSFFVNPGDGAEPRATVLAPFRAGEWYDLASGWDGTNVWISVNGKLAKTPRKGPTRPIGLPAMLSMKSICTMENPSVTGPKVPDFDTDNRCIGVGMRLSLDFTFKSVPQGQTVLLSKHQEYLLRYDSDQKALNFFVFLDGVWENRASLNMSVEPGRRYSCAAHWDGRRIHLAVAGFRPISTNRTGMCRPTRNRLLLGTPGVVEVDNFKMRNSPVTVVSLGDFRTREMMPRVGAPATLTANLVNFGSALGGCEIVASSDVGSIEPKTLKLRGIAASSRNPVEWKVDSQGHGLMFLNFTVKADDRNSISSGVPAVGSRVPRDRVVGKRLVFMPAKDPDLSARAWQPPVKPTETHYVDSDGGDDAKDGLTPATAWRTLKRASALKLGPGGRLLLKRGSVFNEELRLDDICGSAGNWAEIGAYGEGMRPTISRNKMLCEGIGCLMNPSHLVIRDLILANAGSGLMICCPKKDAVGNILVERLLMHHIEGGYRFNSHGIPEWRDTNLPKMPGDHGVGRSSGVRAFGAGMKRLVLRDCESYQCSSGFSADGTDVFVSRMFCHDNYAHNTSPHPYHTASRAWLTDCVFDASGWHAAAGTMGVMLWGNDGFVIRGCHFLNQPDSGSPDQGGIDFEALGENNLVERCTFRNNAGAAIEVLGIGTPQTRNLVIRANRFERNNTCYKNGPAEIEIGGGPGTPREIACSNGIIEDNGYVTVPGVPFYYNVSHSTNDWQVTGNREFAFAEDLRQAYPYADPPTVTIDGEIWTDSAEVALEAKCDQSAAALAWEQVEGQNGVVFAKPNFARTMATMPGAGDYRVQIKADNGTLWRTARTAVHVLPRGARTFYVRNFDRNLDNGGWSAADTGTAYESLPGVSSFWDSKSHPVRLVCGDYYVIAVRNSGAAAIVTAEERDVGTSFSGGRVRDLRIKLQNRTGSKKMRLYYQSKNSPGWTERESVAFDVTPNDSADRVYSLRLPPSAMIGAVKRLKLAFSADGSPISGTVRIDYIWMGKLP